MSDRDNYTGYDCADCGLPLSLARINTVGACACGCTQMVLSLETG
jgi:DNA-directed RNA polymerase subunit RPC12/RpoP